MTSTFSRTPGDHVRGPGIGRALAGGAPPPNGSRPGTLRIRVGQRTTFYELTCIPEVAWGRGFVLTKQDRTSYACNLGDEATGMPPSYECLGFLRWGGRGPCRHLASLQALAHSGELDRAPDPPAQAEATAHGLDPAAADVLWGFDLPRIGDPAAVAALADGLRRDGAKVVILDPVHMGLFAGPDGTLAPAEHAPLLVHAAMRACLDAGATPVFCFPASRGVTAGEPLGLDALPDGVIEFTRQWLLVSRREPAPAGTACG
jgi:hypothetical protein